MIVSVARDFLLGDTHIKHTLVPVMTFHIALGGTCLDQGEDTHVHADGVITVIGSTSSDDFPTIRAIQDHRTAAKNNLFMTKLDASGDQFLFSSYYGGSGNDNAYDSVKDTAGAVYITGSTVPRLFSSYFGDLTTRIDSVNVDHNGNYLLTGTTYSSDFLTKNANQSTLSSLGDAFATKLNRYHQLEYSTYLGGAGSDEGNVVVNSCGDTVFAGYTNSSNFPVSNNAMDTTYNGNGDGFLAKSINSSTIPETVQIENASYIAREGLGLFFQVGIVRSGLLISQVDFLLESRDGTATAGLEYSGISRIITFAPGERRKFITVIIYNDYLYEHENFELIMSNVHGAQLKAPCRALVTIDETTSE